MLGIIVTSTTKVTSNYRITIPKETRKKVGVEVGDELEVTCRGEFIVFRKIAKAKSVLSFAGCWKSYPEDPEKFMKELRELWSNWKVQS